MSGRYRKEKNCLNCGHTVEDHFCSHCGQENIIVEEDALHMIAHATADYFHFESKFFHTIKPLLVKPGWLTQQFVAGKRVAFIHPIRLYIFLSIVFFLVILSGGHKAKEHIKTAPEIKLETQKKDSVVIEKTFSLDLENLRASDKFATVEAYNNYQKTLPKSKRDGFIKNYTIKRNIELRDYPGGVSKKMTEDFVHNLPKMMFLLLPLFALLLKLVYIRKKKYYYEHLIFSFHLHSALFLSALITILFSWLIGFIYNIGYVLQALCSVYIIWYIYRSLRTFYDSKRWITAIKILFLFTGYAILVGITSLIGIALSVILM
ncbi:DUF3667 domain-containing protein [Pedobacter frigoris]|uniref:DUF3667 domain-containing protein n=1 Tax=Pedobacter frigoris TaxID=2571272 RepID=UPI00292DB94F|nr:DUF3667 domain-containing protein [Pedobacter frigoris]